METAAMGKVPVKARIENLRDVYQAQEGSLPAADVRAIEVSDALVDTGATMLSLPKRLIDQLGLEQFRTRSARTSSGISQTGIYEAVRLNIQGRECTVDVAEVPDSCPALIGQIPLEGLDFVIDPVGQKLIGNPEHGGEHMVEIFRRLQRFPSSQS
jgi:clan AA aspartic protease